MPTLNLGRVGFVNKGTWLISTAYKINDTVTYLGGTYACLIANTGQTPILGGTVYWQEWVANDVVHKSGAETIADVKTFTSSPVIPTPADGDSSTKAASTAFVAAAIPYNINAATAKTTPVDADNFGITDSAASNALKKTTWANLKANIPKTTNLLINSNGLVNQRAYVSGTATTVANQYTVDRWRVVTLGQNLTFTTTNGVTTFTAPAGGVEQVIENLNVLGGSYVLTIGGTAAAVVAESTDNVTYTTLTPTNGIYTVTGGKYVKVTFSGGTFSLPQFERGTINTPYEFREFGGEVQACQRYYESISGTVSGGTSMCGNVTSGSVYIGFLKFNTVKRATPIITLTSASAQSFPSTSGSGVSSVYGLYESRTANLTGVGYFSSSYTASAEL